MIRALTLTIILLSICCSGSAGTPSIRVVAVNGAINPVTTDYLRKNLAEAARLQESLVLIEMDTPGGLDTAMREIIKDIFASPIPVAVFVTPSGARAASAGAIIGLSADVLAMSPGTNIGAAHPVSLGEKPDQAMMDKVLNDAEAYVEGVARKRGRNVEAAKSMVRSSTSLSAEKALSGKVADLLAVSREDLLSKLDGRAIDREGKTIVLRLAGVRAELHEMNARQRILDAISNPNVAYMLMMVGFLGIFFELANPGVILPGVIGGISLLLAFFALQTLPVNYAGILLIIFALILFIAEIQIVSNGVLSIGGLIALVLGSLLLFESPEPYLRISWRVIIPTVLTTFMFFMVVVAKGVRIHRQKPISGQEGMVGATGIADSDLAPEGKVFVWGEYWDAWSEEPIDQGDKVSVTAVEGMRLKVRKLKD